MCEVLTLQKRGGGRTSFRHAEEGGGGTTSFEVVLTWELEVLAIGAQKVSTLGGAKSFTLS